MRGSWIIVIVLSCCLTKVLSQCYQTNGLEESEKTFLLDKHNEMRNLLASGNTAGADGNLPQASNMLKMVWDDDLAVKAQEWANQCKFATNKPTTDKFQCVANNLAQTMSSDSSYCTKRPDIDKMLKIWVTKGRGPEVFRDIWISPYQHNRLYGQFTQACWAESYALGCAYSCFNDPTEKVNKYKQILVCNYGPCGNKKERSMYKKGQPCSDCPSGNKECDATYTSLCAN